jgi:hypothetical protein
VSKVNRKKSGVVGGQSEDHPTNDVDMDWIDGKWPAVPFFVTPHGRSDSEEVVPRRLSISMRWGLNWEGVISRPMLTYVAKIVPCQQCRGSMTARQGQRITPMRNISIALSRQVSLKHYVVWGLKWRAAQLSLAQLKPRRSL